jgi:hypothetical protein
MAAYKGRQPFALPTRRPSRYISIQKEVVYDSRAQRFLLFSEPTAGIVQIWGSGAYRSRAKYRASSPIHLLGEQLKRLKNSLVICPPKHKMTQPARCLSTVCGSCYCICKRHPSCNSQAAVERTRCVFMCTCGHVAFLHAASAFQCPCLVAPSVRNCFVNDVFMCAKVLQALVA